MDIINLIENYDENKIFQEIDLITDYNKISNLQDKLYRLYTKIKSRANILKEDDRLYDLAQDIHILNIDTVLDKIKQKPENEEIKEYDEYIKWYDEQYELFSEWKIKLFNTCTLNVTKTEEPGPQEHIWKDETNIYEFNWKYLFGKNNVNLYIIKKILYIDHGDEEKESEWILTVNGKKWYRGNLYLDEAEEFYDEEDEETLYEGDTIFEDFYPDEQEENDEEYIICKVGKYIKIRACHVRNFFKYIIQNCDELKEDD